MHRVKQCAHLCTALIVFNYLKDVVLDMAYFNASIFA